MLSKGFAEESANVVLGGIEHQGIVAFDRGMWSYAFILTTMAPYGGLIWFGRR
jgi:hypothetical protein